MIVYVYRKMLRHLALLIFVNATFIFLIHIPKSSHVHYDMKLVKQTTKDIVFSAALIGISFGAFSTLLVAQYNTLKTW